MDRRGRLLGSLNQSRRDGPALVVSPRFNTRPQIAAEVRPSWKPWFVRAAIVLATSAAGAAWLQLGPSGVRPPSDITEQVDRWLVAKGLGIDQVSLEGHRFTTDADIFDALDLLNAGSMLRFNGSEAANRILRLPWVHRVQIKPLVPNGLYIVISERTPYAVWEHEGRRILIDKSGHRLATIGPSSFADLPRVRGEGANVAVADLHATLALFPAIETRLTMAERVGGRHWALNLSNGPRVLLPAEHDAAAIQQLAALHARTNVLDRDISEIDLRGRSPTVRLATRAVASGSVPPEPSISAPQM